MYDPYSSLSSSSLSYCTVHSNFVSKKKNSYKLLKKKLCDARKNKFSMNNISKINVYKKNFKVEVKFQQQGSVASTFIACCTALRHGRVAFAFKQYFSRELHDLGHDMDVQLLEDVNEPVTRLRVQSTCK
jgi:hypothetical protein